MQDKDNKKRGQKRKGSFSFFTLIAFNYSSNEEEKRKNCSQFYSFLGSFFFIIFWLIAMPKSTEGSLNGKYGKKIWKVKGNERGSRDIIKKNKNFISTNK